LVEEVRNCRDTAGKDKTIQTNYIIRQRSAIQWCSVDYRWSRGAGSPFVGRSDTRGHAPRA